MTTTTKATARLWRALLSALLGLASVPTLAQEGRPPEPLARRVAAAQHPYAFFRGPDLHEAELSPSGRLLAVTTQRGGARVGLYLFDLANGAKVTRLAQFKEVDIWNIHWASDERLLFSAVDYSAGSGSPEGAPGLFSIDVNGGSPTELIERESSLIGDGSRRRTLELNHLLLQVPVGEPSPDGEQVLIAKLRSGGPGLPPLISPLWLNVRTGRAQRGDLVVPGGTHQLLADSRGQPRVAVTLEGRRQTLHWRGPQDRDWRVLASGDLLDMPFTPRWVDDEGRLYVQWRDASGYLVFGLYDFARQAPAAEPLVRVQGFDFQGDVVAAGGRVLGVRIEHDAETTAWFHPSLKHLQAEVDLRLPGKVNRITCQRCDQPDPVVLVRSFSDRDPGRLLIFRPKPPVGQPVMLTVGQVMPGIDPARMARREFLRIEARDGRDLPVWITRPTGLPPGQAAPAVVLVHGGPWIRGGSWQWEDMSQFLASRGYLVLEPEFRGSAGYGDAHFRAGWKQWGQAMQDDVADALLWARQNKLADERACIAGGSYGGYSALMGLVRHPELYRCGIAWAAVTDLELMVEGSWWVRDDASELARRYSLPEMVGDPKKDAALLSAHSPLRQAARIKAPVLLAFGEADLRVPLAHGKRLRDALTAAGNAPEWVSYPGEGHGFVLIQNRLDFALRVERFLATQLAPR